MRARILLLASLVSLPLLAARSSSRSAHAGSIRAVVSITVDARCAGPRSTRVSISPWNAAVRQGDEVNWVLNSGANTDSMMIMPKDPAAWLFDAPPPYVGRKSSPGQGRRMKGNARGRYRYDIGLICRSGNTRDTIVIDPDIIVD